MKTLFTFIFICGFFCLGTAPGASLALAESLEPPALVELAKAEWPQGVKASRAARVRLRIAIDTEGRVTEAAVIESASPELDEAAREALMSSRFSPARRDGEPIASRVEFDFVFPPSADESGEAPPRDEPAGPRAIAGDAGGDEGGSLAEGGDAAARVRSGGDLEEGRPDDPGHEGELAVDVALYGAKGEVRTAAAERRRSVEEVRVVELDEAQARTADLGEVLARTEGITVRRSGGLGSNERISLVGLEGRQIRYFMDGVPLRSMGFGLGLANVPVGLVERVEIFRGVVPIRYGADAVGGAIDLVTDRESAGDGATLSYQTGSFGTHRLAATGRAAHDATGLFVRGHAYLDHARNDYEVDARVGDASGRVTERSVALKNAWYRAYGAAVEGGLSGRPRAKVASLRAFSTDHEKGVPHNVAMTVPYGEVRYGQTDHGLVARYESDLGERRHSLALVGGFVAHRVRFMDQAACAYDWFGQCTLERPVPGEMTVGGRNLVTVERTAHLRASFVARPRDGHAITLSLAPEHSARHTERNTVRDSTLTGRGARTSVVGGVEYELAPVERFRNAAFVKLYAQRLTADDHVFGEVITRETRKTSFGLGDSLRFELAPDLHLKASYEWATRMPASDEVFGDGALTLHNTSLLPERSHNANLSIQGRLERARLGVFRFELALFARRVADLIWLTASADSFEYQNVGEARSIGATVNGSYRSPGDWVDLRASASYQDFRNISEAGQYADVRGDRVPNRPYLEASGEAGVGFDELVAERDRLSLLWGFRYVHRYLLAYESRGGAGTKLTIPSQFVMHAALRYVVSRGGRTLSTVVEAQNLAGVAVYDFYGVQRPRRAVYAKVTLEL